jgi:hypothetical protein
MKVPLEDGFGCTALGHVIDGKCRDMPISYCHRPAE